MKINSITSYNNKISFGKTATAYPEYQLVKNQSFTHTAEPYPEYTNRVASQSSSDLFGEINARLTDLFTPQVKNSAAQIKSDIDGIYLKAQKQVNFGSPKKHLLSVFA